MTPTTVVKYNHLSPLMTTICQWKLHLKAFDPIGKFLQVLLFFVPRLRALLRAGHAFIQDVRCAEYGAAASGSHAAGKKPCCAQRRARGS